MSEPADVAIAPPALELQPLVRPMAERDAALVAAIHIASWRTTYAHLMPAELLAGLDVAERTVQLVEQMRSGAPVRRLVVETHGLLRGFAAHGPVRGVPPRGRRAKTIAELYAIYLDPAFIGRGLGRLLLEHVLQEERAAGRREIVLDVLEGNDRAIGFYTASGFSPDGPAALKEFRGFQLPHLRYRRELEADSSPLER